MVRDWVVGAIKYGPKPGGHPRGRAGLQRVLELKSWCSKGMAFLNSVCAAVIRGPQNVLVVVGFEARWR